MLLLYVYIKYRRIYRSMLSMKHNFQRSRPSPAIISSLKAVSEVTKKSESYYFPAKIYI